MRSNHIDPAQKDSGEARPGEAKAKEPHPKVADDDLPESGSSRQVDLDIVDVGESCVSALNRKYNQALKLSDLPLYPGCARSRDLCNLWDTGRLSGKALLAMVRQENLCVVAEKDLPY